MRMPLLDALSKSVLPCTCLLRVARWQKLLAAQSTKLMATQIHALMHCIAVACNSAGSSMMAATEHNVEAVIPRSILVPYRKVHESRKPRGGLAASEEEEA